MEVVHQARELPLEQCPKPLDRDQDPPQVTLVGNILSAVLGDLAIRMSIAPGLIASGQDMKQLVRSKRAGTPVPADSLLTSGWRQAHVLPELTAVLEGKRLLQVADVLADAPFAYRERADEQ
jgi:ribonuclease D